MDECVVLFCCVEKIDEKNPDRVIESAHQDILVCTFDDPIRIFLIDFFDTTEEDNAFIHPVLTNRNRFCQFCLLCCMEPHGGCMDGEDSHEVPLPTSELIASLVIRPIMCWSGSTTGRAEMECSSIFFAADSIGSSGAVVMTFFDMISSSQRKFFATAFAMSHEVTIPTSCPFDESTGRWLTSRLINRRAVTAVVAPSSMVGTSLIMTSPTMVLERKWEIR